MTFDIKELDIIIDALFDVLINMHATGDDRFEVVVGMLKKFKELKGRKVNEQKSEF